MTFKGCRRGYCLVGTELQPGKMKKFHGSGRTIMRMYFMFLNCTPTVANRNYFTTFYFARRSNQSILKEINPEYSLEGLKLKLQYFGHLMRRADSLEKTLMLGKIEGKRRRGRQRMRWLDGITDSRDMGLSKLWRELKTEEPGALQSMGVEESDSAE